MTWTTLLLKRETDGRRMAAYGARGRTNDVEATIKIQNGGDCVTELLWFEYSLIDLNERLQLYVPNA